jgi:uncharacterized protein (UPF0371 family)
MPDRVYKPISGLTVAEIEAAVARNDPDELLIAVLSAALHSEDRGFALDLCINLAKSMNILMCAATRFLVWLISHVST